MIWWLIVGVHSGGKWDARPPRGPAAPVHFQRVKLLLGSAMCADFCVMYVWCREVGSGITAMAAEGADNEWFIEFLQAIEYGVEEKVGAMLEEDDRLLRIQTLQGITPLALAAKIGHANIVRMLMARDADLHVMDEEERMFALRWACFRAHEGVVRAMVDEDDRLLEARTSEGFTPLILAARCGDVKIVRMLMARGADPHAIDDMERTALHYASYGTHEEIVEVLLDCGANASSVTADGHTPLTVASFQGSLPIVEHICRSLGGQGINHQAHDGSTAISMACSQGHLEISRRLLLEGADHTIPIHIGFDALLMAAIKGYNEIVALLEVSTHTICRECMLLPCGIFQ